MEIEGGHSPLHRRAEHDGISVVIARCLLPHGVFLLLALWLSDAWNPSTTRIPAGFFFEDVAPWSRYPPADMPGWVNPSTSDIPLAFLAHRHLAREQLARGELPLWNELSALGMPLLANQQNALLSPEVLPQVLFGPAGYDWTLFMSISVAAYGMYWLLVQHGTRRVFATAGGVLFVCCGFNTLWLGMPLAAVASYLPALLAATTALARGRRGALWLSMILRVLVLACGHPETAFKVLAGDAVWCVAQRGSVKARFVNLAKIGAVSLVAAGVCAVTIFPFAEYLWHSSGFANRMVDETVERMPWTTCVTSVLPEFYGIPAHRSGEAPTYTGELPYHDFCVFVSFAVVVSVVLAAVGIGKTRVRWPAPWILAACGVLLTYDFGVITRWLFEITLLQITVPHRWVLLTQAAFIVIAARWWDMLRTKGLPWGALLLAGLGVGQALRFTDRFHPLLPSDQVWPATPELEYLAEKTREGGRVFPVGALPAEMHLHFGIPSVDGYDAMWVLRSSRHLAAFGMIKKRVPLDYLPDPHVLGAFNVRYVLANQPLPPLRFDPLKARPIAPESPHRFELQGDAAFLLLEPGSAPEGGQVLDVSTNGGTSEAIAARAGTRHETVPWTLDVGLPARPEYLEEQLGVKHARMLRFHASEATPGASLELRPRRGCFLIAGEPFSDALRRVDLDAKLPIYENALAIGEAFTMDVRLPVPEFPLQLAEVRRFAGDLVGRLPVERLASSHVRAAVDLDQPRRVVFTDVVFPGWKLLVDGKETAIEVVADLYPSTIVPAGTHVVEWIYRPLSFTLGCLVSGICVLGVLGWVVSRLRGGGDRSRRSRSFRAEGREPARIPAG